jgi:3-oxoacyl-[acyl-carrier protein] reductase
MRRLFVRSNRSESFAHTRSSAGFTIITAGFEFPVHTGFEIDFAAGSYGAFKAALFPGNTYFEGGIWQNIEKGSPDLYKMAMSLNPTSRMGTPQEVAAGVVFVASPVATRISGTNLIIDGALTKAV